jgi:hypothetical protein
LLKTPFQTLLVNGLKQFVLDSQNFIVVSVVYRSDRRRWGLEGLTVGSGDDAKGIGAEEER